MLLGVLMFLSAQFGQEGYTQEGCGSQCPEPTNLSFDVTDFGATPDDETDEDLSAFQAAVDRASAASLENNACAVVSVPAGTYHFQQPQGLAMKSNVCLIGEDRDRTIVIGLVPMNAISMTQIDNASVENLTIDNARATPESMGTHGIRLSHASNILLEGLNIRNTYYYGIGFQGNGRFQQITVNDVDIRNTIADAIDFKNRENSNSDILLSDIDITDFGMARDSQAGIDLRGSDFIMRNINISGVKAGQSGIRFRFTGDGNNGIGGIKSKLEDSRISGVAEGGIGIDVTNTNNTIQSTIISGVSGYEKQGTGISILPVDKPGTDTDTLISFVAILNLDKGVISNAKGVAIDTSAFLSNNVHIDDRLDAAIVTNSAFSGASAFQQHTTNLNTNVRRPSEK